MKKIIGVAAFAVLGMVALSSCKKDYTCECDIMDTTTSQVFKDVKKKDATDACDALSTAAAIVDGSCSIK